MHKINTFLYLQKYKKINNKKNPMILDLEKKSKTEL